MKTPIIITERLILREVKKDDVNDIRVQLKCL